MSTVKVNTVTTRSGSTLTLGESGKTVALASGASQTGFGRNGSVNWQTSIKTTGFTAVSGEGYFCDTNASGAFSLTLPASPSAGDIVALADYATSFDTANLTLARNGSNIEGAASDLVINNAGESLTVVYADATKGWIVVGSGNSDDVRTTPAFIAASGGSETCTGDFKIHTFTGPGTFTVSCAGNFAGSNTLEYLVIAGGGSGGSSANGPNYRGGGGGGAGGYRESSGTTAGCYSVSPLGSGVNGVTANAQAYPITVGGGGAGSCNANNEGTNSTLGSEITSAGGGGGGRDSANPACGAGSAGQADNGGSGGGAAAAATGLKVKGAGNTPPVNPAQGTDGGGPNTGTGGCSCNGSGGGGATVAGTKASSPSGGAGGTGATSNITNTPTARATGGVGGTNGPNSSGAAAPANSGSGGGGANGGPSDIGGGNGGSGLVVIRYKYQ